MPASTHAARSSSAVTAWEMRRAILDASKRANVGHIGSCLSVVDVLAVVFDVARSGLGTAAGDRDRFILSKGHAGLALYAALQQAGLLDEAELHGFCGDGSGLAVHPDHAVPGVDFSTGSLGMGLSFGVGAALAARLDGSSRQVYVLLSDAECNEGAVWEAAMFAAHHRLGNLTAIVDENGQQALGFTRDVLDLGDLEARWRAFGWQAATVDGHDHGALAAALAAPTGESKPPRVVVAETTFGKGVSFMESQIEWHYRPMSDEQYARATDEVEQARP
ncbi:MAG TPA: transketolase [Gaiellaceae bacterium]|nr:transketolase [Gaiellaceae bacterium]